VLAVQIPGQSEAANEGELQDEVHGLVALGAVVDVSAHHEGVEPSERPVADDSDDEVAVSEQARGVPRRVALGQREEVEVARPLQRARGAEEEGRGELGGGVGQEVVEAEHDSEEDDEGEVEVFTLPEPVEQDGTDEGGAEATDGEGDVEGLGEGDGGFTIIIYFSTFTIRQRSNSLFVGPLAGFFKCLTLFCFDFSMTLTGHLSSLSVCHTKNIISLNTSIHTTVSWNWLSQDLYRFILRGNIYAIECTCGTIHVLWDLSDSPRLS